MPLNAAELQVSLAGPEVGPLRVRLANASREAIRSGRPGPGTTLPSTRILARDLGLSHGVVVDAYNRLAAEGFIRGRPQPGHDERRLGAPDLPRRAYGSQRRLHSHVPQHFSLGAS